jgi:hypothetical protein
MHVPVSVIVPVSLHKVLYEPDRKVSHGDRSSALSFYPSKCFRASGPFVLVQPQRQGLGKLCRTSETVVFRETLKLDCDDETNAICNVNLNVGICNIQNNKILEPAFELSSIFTNHCGGRNDEQQRQTNSIGN